MWNRSARHVGHALHYSDRGVPLFPLRTSPVSSRAGQAFAQALLSWALAASCTVQPVRGAAAGVAQLRLQRSTAGSEAGAFAREPRRPVRRGAPVGLCVRRRQVAHLGQRIATAAAAAFSGVFFIGSLLRWPVVMSRRLFSGMVPVAGRTTRSAFGRKTFQFSFRSGAIADVVKRSTQRR